MFSRAGAAVCAAAIAGMLMVPAQLSARGAVGHPGGFRPMVRPMHRVHHPIMRPVHRTHLPFVHHRRAPFAHRQFDKRHGFHALARRHHRGIFTVPLFGYGIPVTYDDDGAFYGTYYDPSDVPGPSVLPAYAVPPAPLSILAGAPEPPIERVGCRSQTVSVPSPSGAERSVTITRC
jgi:hypothetical protein